MKTIILAAAMLASAACNSGAKAENTTTDNVPGYKNPVVAQNLPDPTIIKAGDGNFYLYATGEITPVWRSADLVNWHEVGQAFTQAGRPSWEPDAGMWAPDINYIDGRWVLFYSMSVWGGEWTCGIGVAVADSPTGPFTDQGRLFRSNEIGVQNSIDPFYIEDEGRKWLVWGSFRGIYAIELADNGLAVREGAEKQQIAGTDFEGVYIHKRDGKYYMFASVGSCCEGVRSTYRLVVGRADALHGPYHDREGRSMMEGGYTVVIGSNEAFVGNGHCSEIVQDDAGQDWIFYHGVNTARPEGRMLMMDQVRWDNNEWPYVTGGAPSAWAPAPIFDEGASRALGVSGGGMVIANPIDIKLGDPFILQEPDGRFWLYGTSGEEGFRAWSSDNMSDWQDEGLVYQGAGADSWTVDCFWAPEVYRRGGKYYLMFSANWKHNPGREEENFRIGVAVADSPRGPFVEVTGVGDAPTGPLFDPGYPVIDGNVMWTDDGRVWLYFSRCCYKHPVESEVAAWARKQGWFDKVEESWIYGVELRPDLSGVIGEPVMLLAPPATMNDPQAEWESRSVTSREVGRRWTEGSYIIERDGWFYMMYSANFFGGENYAVGYAVSQSPLGPFTKAANNPVLEKQGVVTGTGHNMILETKDGKLWCVYHGRTSLTGEERVVFIDPMEMVSGGGGAAGPGELRVYGPTVKPGF